MRDSSNKSLRYLQTLEISWTRMHWDALGVFGPEPLSLVGRPPASISPVPRFQSFREDVPAVRPGWVIWVPVPPRILPAKGQWLYGAFCWHLYMTHFVNEWHIRKVPWLRRSMKKTPPTELLELSSRDACRKDFTSYVTAPLWPFACQNVHEHFKILQGSWQFVDWDPMSTPIIIIIGSISSSVRAVFKPSAAEASSFEAPPESNPKCSNNWIQAVSRDCDLTEMQHFMMPGHAHSTACLSKLLVFFF